MKRLLLMTLIIVVGMMGFCRTISAQSKIPVYVSIPPQKFFVESVGGNLVEVSVMVAPGANPHNYEPTSKQMKALSSAKIYFAIGDPFEDTWLTRFSAANPNMKIIHSEDGVEKKPIHRHESMIPSQAETEQDQGHFHGINDPHIWLSPPLVMIQARNILTALTDSSPEHRDVLESNYRKFINQLIDLDATLLLLFKDDANKQFLVLHPSWGYFAEAYRLKQCSIEIEGKEPKAKELSQLIQYAQVHGIKDILAQPQFSPKQSDIIAKEINGRVVYADPLAENWMENLTSVAASIKQAIR
jgi:zinc transport system substrate-binding protein